VVMEVMKVKKDDMINAILLQKRVHWTNQCY
jgi:hypothetical protein